MGKVSVGWQRFTFRAGFPELLSTLGWWRSPIIPRGLGTTSWLSGSGRKQKASWRWSEDGDHTVLDAESCWLDGCPSSAWGHRGQLDEEPNQVSFFFNVFLFLAALGLHCRVWAFSSCSVQELLSSHGAKASHCGGFSCWGAQALGPTGSVAAAHGRSCSTAYRISPGQGLNLCPLHWQADSYPLYHQGSPK